MSSYKPPAGPANDRAPRRRPTAPRALIRGAVAPATADRYAEAVAEFMSWADAVGVIGSAGIQALSLADIDEALAEWVGFVHGAWLGRRQQTAVNGVFGLIHEHPRLRDALPTARRALKAWKRECPASPHPPLGPDVMALIALEMAIAGDWRACAQTVVGFHCLLRISELAGLTAADVGLPNDAAVSGASHTRVMYLRLRQTKTGREQHVTVPDANASDFVRWAMAGLAGSDALFIGAAAYRKRLAMSCARLRLPVSYVPHSLRHGGATHMYNSGVPLQSILIAGRWKQHQSAAHYVQSGRHAMLALRHDPQLLELGRALFPQIYLAATMAYRVAMAGPVAVEVVHNVATAHHTATTATAAAEQPPARARRSRSRTQRGGRQRVHTPSRPVRARDGQRLRVARSPSAPRRAGGSGAGAGAATAAREPSP